MFLCVHFSLCLRLPLSVFLSLHTICALNLLCFDVGAKCVVALLPHFTAA